MAHDSSAVRIGPVSIFSLIIILCLCVMGALSLTTAQAGVSEAEKQVAFVDDTYANEVEAQQFVAQVDDALASVKERQGGLADVPSVLAQQCGEDAQIEGDAASVRITRSFWTGEGRALTVALRVGPDLAYQIEEWKISTQWSPEAPGKLWDGQ